MFCSSRPVCRVPMKRAPTTVPKTVNWPRPSTEVPMKAATKGGRKRPWPAVG
jgi:hypothetical protein